MTRASGDDVKDGIKVVLGHAIQCWHWALFSMISMIKYTIYTAFQTAGQVLFVLPALALKFFNLRKTRLLEYNNCYNIYYNPVTIATFLASVHNIFLVVVIHVLRYFKGSFNIWAGQNRNGLFVEMFVFSLNLIVWIVLTFLREMIHVYWSF